MMTRLEAIRVIIDHIQDRNIVIHANGAISRESFYCKNRELNFYLLGSMGLPSSVALGIAINSPNRQVVVLDGDGNLLMGYGNLAQVGALKPKNFFHFVLDNSAYATTGNQPSISSYIDFENAALASGYSHVYFSDNISSLEKILSKIFTLNGPQLIRVKVSLQIPIKTQRIPFSAEEMKLRFMNALLPQNS